jgi:diphthamide biosynthesis protein 4
MTPEASPTHYEILDLPSSLQDGPALSAQTLRAAYRRALLRWHPDKSNTNVGTLKCTNSIDQGKFSIDQISNAYTTLSDSKKRGEYDKELKAQKTLGGNTNGNGWETKFKTGVDVVDLENLEYDDAQGVWYRGCRCGDERGFEIREEDLEEGQADGEVVVGCKGCSLWLRVLFGVVEDEITGEGMRDADGLNGICSYQGT